MNPHPSKSPYFDDNRRWEDSIRSYNDVYPDRRVQVGDLVYVSVITLDFRPRFVITDRAAWMKAAVSCSK